VIRLSAGSGPQYPARLPASPIYGVAARQVKANRGSLLVTSQVPVNRWHEVIGDPTLADAILDRIIHRAHRIDLKGPSLRRRLVASESSAA
jgi:hypothetical protein